MRIKLKDFLFQYFYKVFGKSSKEIIRQEIIYGIKQGLLSYCREKQFFVNRLGIVNITVVDIKKGKSSCVEIETIRQNIMIGYNYSSIKNIEKHIKKYVKHPFTLKIVHYPIWDDVKFDDITSESMECDKFVCDDCGKCTYSFKDQSE